MFLLTGNPGLRVWHPIGSSHWHFTRLDASLARKSQIAVGENLLEVSGKAVK